MCVETMDENEVYVVKKTEKKLEEKTIINDFIDFF